MANKKQVLFLCTGNYYRSRFAEILFNHLAQEADVTWTAVSRGLKLSRNNIGRISRYALLGLDERGVPVPNPQPFPKAVDEDALKQAAIIIAVKEVEHRPLMHKQFPQWEKQTLYWNVHDLDKATPREALSMLEGQIKALFHHLSKQESELII